MNTTSEKSSCQQGSAWYFNNLSEAYIDQYFVESPGGHALRTRKELVLELLNDVNGKVLDVGCGPGVMVEDLTDLGYEVCAVDAAPRMVEECYRRFGHLPRVHCSVGSVTALNLPNEAFDAVICMGVIDRIQAYDLALKEMARVVRKGGTLLISFPNLSSPYAAWKKFIFYPMVALLQSIYSTCVRRPLSPSLLSSFAKLYTSRAASELMERYEFEVKDVVYFNFNVFLSPLDEIFPGWALKMTRRLEKFRFGRLKRLGAGFILKGKKRC
jgi:ubiquinone/menaquinone biosynthesis C-methylase UbiE